MFIAAAVRKNPLAKQTTTKTLQVTTAKWLYGSRDRAGGHKERTERRQRSQIHADMGSDND